MSRDLEVSVVVATRNRAARLESLLGSLRGQTLAPGSFEVLVVDDGSEDGTPEVLERAARNGDLALEVVPTPQIRGPAASRNAGWRAARAPLIAFTDDDCEPDEGWLQAMLRAAERHPGAVLQGFTEPIERERDALGPFSRTIEVDQLGPWFQTCNVAYPRELLEALGGFDEVAFAGGPSAEDVDLAWRALRGGSGAVLVADARVYHAVNQLGALGKLRVATRWGGLVVAFRRHPPLRAHLHRRMFWKLSHELLLRAALGLLLGRRNRLALILVAPYLRDVWLRGRAQGLAPPLAPYLVIHDLVEFATLAKASIRHRRLVL